MINDSSYAIILFEIIFENNKRLPDEQPFDLI